jgi:prepilin-type N-terminal cleavage/methylation domain-containing protein
MRRGFTLVEMLMVIAIIGILAAMAIAALAGAAEQGRRQRAETQIARIDQLLSEKWNSYRFRQLPVRIPAGQQQNYAARIRLDVLRELVRMEMPDCLNDVLDDPASPAPLPTVQGPNPSLYAARQPRPSVSNAYLRMVQAAPNSLNPRQWESSECLYLILHEMRDGEDNALQHFLPSEIGDTDGDGLNEILDPWGTPILFFRWAPGYSKYDSTAPELANELLPPYPVLDVAVDTFQVPTGHLQPDPFDPLKIDPRWNPSVSGMTGLYPFELRPLVVCAGPDRQHDLYAPGFTYHANASNPLNDPYAFHVTPIGNKWSGQPFDQDGDGLNHSDNITNHGLGLRE